MSLLWIAYLLLFRSVSGMPFWGGYVWMNGYSVNLAPSRLFNKEISGLVVLIRSWYYLVSHYWWTYTLVCSDLFSCSDFISCICRNPRDELACSILNQYSNDIWRLDLESCNLWPLVNCGWRSMTDTKRKKTPNLMEGRGFSFFLFELQRNLTLTKVPKHKHVYPYIHVQKK